jgi:hypothetical protein
VAALTPRLLRLARDDLLRFRLTHAFACVSLYRLGHGEPDLLLLCHNSPDCAVHSSVWTTLGWGALGIFVQVRSEFAPSHDKALE